MQQSVFHRGLADLDALGQHETALKLACGDATVQEHPPFRVVPLTSADHQALLFEGDRQVGIGKSRHGKGDAIGGLRGLFDIIGRITVISGFRRPFDQPFKLFEAKQERVCPKGQFRHGVHVLIQSDSPVRGPGVNVSATPYPKYGQAKAAAQVCRLVAGHAHPYVARNAGMIPGREQMNTSARMEQLDVLRVKLAVLKSEHRDLDLAIEALHARGSMDMLTLKRLKKQKLGLKDRIVALEDRILPDIIA